jgi:poly(A) polymerase
MSPRRYRFGRIHHFVIEPIHLVKLFELSSTIIPRNAGSSPEEMLKLFLFGAARPACGLMYESGLLAALFPELAKWLGENPDRLNILTTNLGCLDQQYQRGTSPSPALFFAAFFGPLLEERALAGHWDGIPIRLTQAAVCREFIAECSKTVSIPGKVVNQLRNGLAMQHVLHKVPPRRPSVIARRPEFTDALAYLHLADESKGASSSAPAWWNAFLSGKPLSVPTETPTDKAPAKRRRRRKRRRRPAAPADTIHG